MKHRLSCSLLSLAFLAFLPGCDAVDEDPALEKSSETGSYMVEGMSLVLPAPPQGPQLLRTSPQLAGIIKRQAIYVAGDPNLSVTVFHVEQAAGKQVYIGFAVEGALENMRKVPGTTDFTSEEVKNRIFPGWKTVEILVKLKHDGLAKEIRILTLAREHHLYQITIEGAGAGDAVAECASRVFSSITLPAVK